MAAPNAQRFIWLTPGGNTQNAHAKTHTHARALPSPSFMRATTTKRQTNSSCWPILLTSSTEATAQKQQRPACGIAATAPGTTRKKNTPPLRAMEPISGKLPQGFGQCDLHARRRSVSCCKTHWRATGRTTTRRKRGGKHPRKL